ncbi:hypothetical protein DFH08DRAFT_724456 [Mycena albidolilacea]|uniref:Uncharacterized protein n=1 Tax=Mycena albidolilacea TaxID=1033008 RepID=A0AAD6YXK0_9AGAR|nr:hypothetical protein DFH08DRAFT_724456 [Mycena albidolilacea]
MSTCHAKHRSSHQVNTLCDKIRSLGKIGIPTMTEVFTVQLYPGGQTTHSAFKVRCEI